MRLGLITLMGLLASVSTVRAEPTTKIVGNWLVSSEADRFGDGGTHFVAVAASGMTFATRCIQKMPSFGLVELGGDPKPMTGGDVFKIKIRVDQKPIHETAGIVISERLIQIPSDNDTWREIRNSKEIAVRVETVRATTQTYVFKSRGAAKVLPVVERECPLKDGRVRQMPALRLVLSIWRGDVRESRRATLPKPVSHNDPVVELAALIESGDTSDESLKRIAELMRGPD